MTNNNLKKKIDNVNTEFIRYIEQREERKSTQVTLPPPQNNHEEEEE
jgi:hypothetical protein